MSWNGPTSNVVDPFCYKTIVHPMAPFARNFIEIYRNYTVKLAGVDLNPKKRYKQHFLSNNDIFNG